MQSLQSLVPFLHELADIAAEQILTRFRRDDSVANKAGDGDFDPVTQADRQAESAMRSAIEARFPDHGILGEEFGSVRTDAETVWVLDPIDGTGAFICGLPLWGVLIGVRHKGQPALGMIAQPYLDERFCGNGATASFRHGTSEVPMKTRPCTDLSQATLSTTSPDLFNPGLLARFQHLRSQVRLCRYGYDCYAYAMLAMGRIDCIVESDLKAFDIEPIVPIIEGAGGRVTNFSGGSVVGGGDVVATGDPALHDQVLAVIAAG